MYIYTYIYKCIYDIYVCVCVLVVNYLWWLSPRPPSSWTLEAGPPSCKRELQTTPIALFDMVCYLNSTGCSAVSCRTGCSQSTSST